MNRLRLVLAAMLLLAWSGNLLAAERLVGGPCAYAAYPGTALIVVVRPRPLRPGEAGPGYQPCEVLFTFTPDAPVPAGLYEPGRDYRLTLADGRDPGARLTQDAGLMPGHSRPCVLRVITKGTCTPLIFSFPGLDAAAGPGPR